MATPQSEYEKLRATGIGHNEVMRRMSAANRKVVAKADYKLATTGQGYVVGDLASGQTTGHAVGVPETTASISPPKQIIAEVDDDFESLSKKLGIDTQDLIKANVDDTSIKAGAVYNVPAQSLNIPQKPLASPPFDPNDPFGTKLKRLVSSFTPGGETPYNVIKEDFPGKTPQERMDALLKVTSKFGDIFKWLLPDNDEQSLNLGGKPLASPAFQPPPPQAEFADFKQAEAQALASDQYGDPFAGTAADDYWNTLGGANTDLSAFDPFPTMPGSVDYSDTKNIYDAASQQMKDIYDLDPTIRYGKFGFDILGLEAFENQGNMDAIAEIALEPFMKPFTANYAASFGNDVSAVWNPDTGQYELKGAINLDTLPPGDVNRLVDLGYITLPTGGGVSTDGYSSSGVTARYPRIPSAAGGRTYGSQDYRRNPSYLGLVSWSI